MDTFTEYKPIKQRLFLTLHIGIKNITDKASSNYIRTQNAERERYYRYQIPIDNVLVSNQKKHTLFPYAAPLTYAMLSDDLNKITPNVQQDISLLQAVEYLAFGWSPTDTRSNKLFGQKRFYQTEPGSLDGQDQIRKLKVACERLEVLLELGLDCSLPKNNGKPANKFVEPKVVFDNTNTSFITLTDTTTNMSFDDITVNFIDLMRCVKHLNYFKQHPIVFRLFLDGNELKLQKNSGFATVIHHFNETNATTSNTYSILQYVMNREGQEVKIKDVAKYFPTQSGKTNFNTNLARVFGKVKDPRLNRLKNAVKKNFFPTFEGKVIKFQSTVDYVPELDE